MKNIIITILLILCAITSFAQLDTVTVSAGQYSIHGLNIIDSTIVRQNAGSYSIIYDSRYSTVSVADTVFYIPATSGLDTISNFTRPSGKLAAILLERGGKWKETITVPDDSLIFDVYGSGYSTVIDGADVITGFSIYIDTTNVISKTEWNDSEYWDLIDDNVTLYTDSIVINCDGSAYMLWKNNFLTNGNVYEWYMNITEKAGSTGNLLVIYDTAGGYTTISSTGA